MPNRNQVDAKFTTTKYLPAAAATNYSDVLDLGSAIGQTEGVNVKIVVPALANHTDSTKTILIDLYDSADNSSFTVGSPLIRCQVAGVTSTGSSAATFQFALPPGTRRYVKFLQTVPSGAGDNTGGLVDYSLRF